MCKTEDNELFVNPKETYDGAIPSGNSVMAYNFIRLYQLTEKEEFNDLAKKQIEFMSPKAEGYPAGNSLFLLALLIYENPPAHIVITLKESADREKVIDNLPLFSNVVLTDESSEYPLINDKTTYYVCRDHMCQPPTNSLFNALNDKSFTLP